MLCARSSTQAPPAFFNAAQYPATLGAGASARGAAGERDGDGRELVATAAAAAALATPEAVEGAGCAGSDGALGLAGGASVKLRRVAGSVSSGASALIRRAHHAAAATLIANTMSAAQGHARPSAIIPATNPTQSATQARRHQDGGKQSERGHLSERACRPLQFERKQPHPVGEESGQIAISTRACSRSEAWGASSSYAGCDISRPGRRADRRSASR